MTTRRDCSSSAPFGRTSLLLAGSAAIALLMQGFQWLCAGAQIGRTGVGPRSHVAILVGSGYIICAVPIGIWLWFRMRHFLRNPCVHGKAVVIVVRSLFCGSVVQFVILQSDVEDAMVAIARSLSPLWP